MDYYNVRVRTRAPRADFRPGAFGGQVEQMYFIFFVPIFLSSSSLPGFQRRDFHFAGPAVPRRSNRWPSEADLARVTSDGMSTAYSAARGDPCPSQHHINNDSYNITALLFYYISNESFLFFFF